MVRLQRPAPAEVAHTALRVIVARDLPAADVVRTRREPQRLRGIRKQNLDPLRDELGVRQLLSADLPAHPQRVRIVRIRGVDRGQGTREPARVGQGIQ